MNDFPSKWDKVIQKIPEFKDIADNSDIDELKRIILQCESNIYVVEKERENDEKLIAAKEVIKEIMEPYRDSLKIQNAKIKYALFLLESKGVDITSLNLKPK